MADSGISEKGQVRKVIEGILFLGLFGYAVAIGTGLVLRWLDVGSSSSDWAVIPSAENPFIFSEHYAAMEDPFEADLLATFEVVRARWSYAEHRADLSGLDLDALEQEARDILGSPGTKLSFHLAMRRYIAGLEDGHAFVSFPLALFFEGHRWPFSLVEVEEGIMIYGVTEVFDWEEDVLPPNRRPQQGDLLLSVDGRPVDDWIRETEQAVYASSEASRRAEAVDHMVRTDTSSQRTFTFLSKDGEPFFWECALPAHYRTVPTAPGLPREPLHQMLDGNIGYFRPGDFTPPPDRGWPGPPEHRDAILADSYARLDKVIAELSDAKGLILDLRNNPGGTDLLGMYLVDRLMQDSYVYYRLSAATKNGFTSFRDHESTAPAGDASYRGPIVCMIDEGTFSTADNVAACLHAVHPNVQFVGRPNGAGTGAPRPFELPRTGTTVSFCTMRVQTPEGQMGEGIPVPLDQAVTWTREDVLQGRDPDLEVALALLRP